MRILHPTFDQPQRTLFVNYNFFDFVWIDPYMVWASGVQSTVTNFYSTSLFGISSFDQSAIIRMYGVDLCLY